MTPTDAPFADVPDTEDLPVGSWWLVPPAQFSHAVATYNVTQKILGESELPPPVRDYLHQLEREQHLADSEIVAKPTR